jgi:hypothetical protein
MHRQSFIHCAIVFGVITFLPGILGSSANAASALTNTPVQPAATTPANTVAAGSTEDSLQACLARIPKDATVGQRMIAEQGCRRDEADRNPGPTFSGR